MRAQKLLTVAALAAGVAMVACGKKHKESVSGQVDNRACPQFLNGPWLFKHGNQETGFTGVVDGRNPLQLINAEGEAFIVDGTQKQTSDKKTVYEASCASGTLKLNYSTADGSKKGTWEITTESNGKGLIKVTEHTSADGKPVHVEESPISRPGAPAPAQKPEAAWAPPQDPTLKK